MARVMAHIGTSTQDVMVKSPGHQLPAAPNCSAQNGGPSQRHGDRSPLPSRNLSPTTLWDTAESTHDLASRLSANVLNARGAKPRCFGLADPTQIGDTN